MTSISSAGWERTPTAIPMCSGASARRSSSSSPSRRGRPPPLCSLPNTSGSSTSSTNGATRSSRTCSRPTSSAAVREALAPHLADGPYGRNEFEGFETQRVYSLPVKSRAFDRLIEDDVVLAAGENLLGPNFLLTAALAINLGPGETAQGLHFDEAFYSLPRPRPPLSLSALWAIDDFTADNGGTLIVPRSHRWGGEGPTPDVEVVPLEMPAGSVAIYPGTLWHAGGANVTDHFRLGISIQYVISWARQQESYLLAMPPDAAASVSPRLRALLGYSIGPAFMGHVDGRHPEKLVSRG